jgi:uncharacterized membrane protein
MSARGRHLLLTVGAGLLIALYIALLHIVTARETPSLAGAALALGPVAVTGVWLAWASRFRVPALLLCALAFGGLYAAREVLASNFAWVTLIQHAGTFAVLTGVFGRTLAPGRTPMVSLFARRVHGPLAPRLAHYTRRVTQVWTLVFALLATVSLALFASGQIAAWSLFANVLTPALIPTVFLVEYLVRRTILPRELQTGLIDSVRSAWPAFDDWLVRHDEHGQPASPADPRP